MTTSGQATWSPAVTDMVTQSLRNLGVIAENEQPTGEMYADGVTKLNGIVAAAQAEGLHVWTEEEAILFPQVGVPKYVIGGPTASLNAHTSDADTWIELQLAQSYLAGSTVLALQTITGTNLAGLAQLPLVGDSFGVVLNSGLTFWTTVDAVGASTVTIHDPLPASGASQGAWCFDYTTPIVRPLKVPGARLLQLNGLIDTEMTIMSRQEYQQLPNKMAPGTPTQWFYSPRRDQGLFYIWPVPVTTMWAIRFTWYRPLQDFFLPTNTQDFPQEWTNPLIWRLSKDWMGVFDTPPPRQQLIIAQDDYYWNLASNYDRESEPVIFGMDWTATGDY